MAPDIVLDADARSEPTSPDAAVPAWVAAQRRAGLCMVAVNEVELAHGLV